MAPSYALFYLLFLFLLLLLVESQDTSFKIDAFTPHSRLLTYERDAFVPPDKTYVRLAGLDGSSGTTVGRVLYSTPVKLWTKGRQASFETTITMQTTPVTTPGNAPEGMIFFIVPVNSTLTTGGYGGNLGIYDALVPGSPFLTVEIDRNSNTTIDSAYSHVGININSIRSPNYTYFGFKPSEKKVTMRITYDVLTRKISVVATTGSTTAKVSFAYNLKILLPDEIQVGLSASTGATGGLYVAYYDVFTWHFDSTMVPDDTYIKQYVM